MALTTKPKSGAMADSVKNISTARSNANFNDKPHITYEDPSKAPKKLRKPSTAYGPGRLENLAPTSSPFPPKKPMTTSPFPPKKPAMKKAKGGMVRGTGCAVRGTKTAKQY